MKSRLRQFITDVFHLYLLRIKLIFKDFTTVSVLFVAMVIFALMVRSMTVSVEDFSALPIGIVDYDNSDSSRELIAGLKTVETLRIIEKSEEELQKLLLDEMLHSVFIIEAGYEDNLKSGELKNIITMYYKKDNKSATILSDIVAGEIIYPASLYKGFQYYDKLPFKGEKLSEAGYQEYIDELVQKSKDFNFAFQINYAKQGENVSTEKNLRNSVLYNQFIIGILGILIAFTAMFILSQTVREKEMGVELRLKISRFHILKRDLANLSALLTGEGLVSLVFIGLIFRQFKNEDIKLWLSAYLLLILIALVLGEVMLLFSKLIQRMLIYQVFCSIFILLTGGAGFYYLLSGFYQGILENSIKLIPNSWFIMGFTDIIVYGGKNGYLKEGHLVLFIMAVTIMLIVIGIDIIKGFPNKRNYDASADWRL